jgi:hypothetical protein
VTRTTIRSFLREHLPDCRCPTPAPTYPRQVRAALGHLLRLPGGPFQRSGSAACLASIRFPGRRQLFLPDASAGCYSGEGGVWRPFFACSTR